MKLLQHLVVFMIWSKQQPLVSPNHGLGLTLQFGGRTRKVRTGVNMSNENTRESTVAVKYVEDQKNPYAYLDRADFTSEKFKIEVRGLPKYYGISEFKRLLTERLELRLSKVKPPKRGSGWVYVCFRNEEDRKKAIAAINGLSWKNSKLTAQSAKPAPDPFVKRKMEREEDSSKKKKKDDDADAIPPAERIKMSTTPLWDMPYDDQLKLKENEIKSVLKKLGQQMSKENSDLTDWIESQKGLHQGLLCDVQPILRADMIDGYRNKCEFTIGKSEMSGTVTIGFRLSSYAAGCTAVGPVEDLKHIPQRMIDAVKVFEGFVRKSKLDVFDPVNHSGYWRQVTARTSRSDQLMLIVTIHPQDLNQGQLIQLKAEIREFFNSDEGAKANVTSLYFQTITRRDVGGEGGIILDHLSGTEYIEEELLGMKFRVSPRAFFQINTLGAEVLYKAAIDLAQPTLDTTVLDVCCGTGTIGISFSKYCGEVLGLEMIDDAIKDAKQNTLTNGITNCEFFVGKAEDILSPVIQRATKHNLIAIVDPPRAGLHQRALITLRKAKRLHKLVYISCDPKAAIKNLIDLARPTSKQYQGEPLIPIKAVPVDMFPYTKHCELVIYLERFSKAKAAGNQTG
ncbi:tRNA (uracil-5-)-methyltransferase homolog A [Neodiprion lecontei]|uniref:tRNA (uracil(54)-C(5))-methyltransferase n=1 Tax=Neodiprion lecontei TaxID=441921 RepID=A0ABM3G032_NEOLC|nr:tRNA (uracil-5-)-methyltransferase homolog A [Neodiprion lecontei]